MNMSVRHLHVCVLSLIALAAAACGGQAEVGGGDRAPIVGGETGGKASGTGGAKDDDPISNTGGNTSAGGTTSNGGTTTGPAANAACDRAFDQQNPGDKVCNSTYQGKCFESDAEACACAGCGDACSVAESYPSQVFCPTKPVCKGGGDYSSSSDDKCNYVYQGICFAEGEAACACAGCAIDKCLILESYPAQVHCEQ